MCCLQKSRRISCLFLLLLCLVDFAQAGGRRSLRVDSGDWGSAFDCDSGQLSGSLLQWQGYTFAAYDGMTVGSSICQFVTALSAAQLGDPEDLDIRDILNPGETVTAARYLVTSDLDPFFLDLGDIGFQWVFYYFPDAVIVAMNGPSVGIEDFSEAALATDADTTYLGFGSGPVLWDGTGFDGEYLCFGIDGSFKGAFAGADLASCRAGAGAATTLPILLELPDLNTNATRDIAVLRDEGPFVAEIRDGLTNALIAKVSFLDAGYEPLAALSLPDTDGNGIAEIAVLARRTSDGRGFVQIRNLIGAQLPRTIAYTAGYSPLDLGFVSDADGNGIADLGMLSTRDRDGRGFVETRNVLGAANRQVMKLHPDAAPRKLRVIDDSGYAVLALRGSDGRPMVQIGNVDDAAPTSTMLFRQGRLPLDFAIIDDVDDDQVPEVAVLLVSNASARTLVDMRNVSGSTATYTVSFSAGYSAVALGAVADADGNGTPEVAIVAIRDSDGQARTEIRNAAGTANAKAILMPVSHRARGLSVLNDLSGNGVPELAVLATHASNGRIKVFSRNARGLLELENYAFDK